MLLYRLPDHTVFILNIITLGGEVVLCFIMLGIKILTIVMLDVVMLSNATTLFSADFTCSLFTPDVIR
jgi:molybdopterin/thiamine biosynthesis adenylyltransferase